MSLTVLVDVKQHWTMLQHWSQFVLNMSTDIRGHEARHHHQINRITKHIDWVIYSLMFVICPIAIVLHCPHLPFEMINYKLSFADTPQPSPRQSTSCTTASSRPPVSPSPTQACAWQQTHCLTAWWTNSKTITSSARMPRWRPKASVTSWEISSSKWAPPPLLAVLRVSSWR